MSKFKNKLYVQAVKSVLKKHLKMSKLPRSNVVEKFTTILLKMNSKGVIHSSVLRNVPLLKNLLITKDIYRNYSSGLKSQGYVCNLVFQEICLEIEAEIRVIEKQKPLPKFKSFCIPNNTFIAYLSEKMTGFDRLSLILNTIGKTENDDFIIDNSKSSTSFNGKSIGRVYSTFSRIKSDLRQFTDFKYEIDLDASVQSLYLSIYAVMNDIDITQAKNTFLAYSAYIDNKSAIRSDLSFVTGFSEKKIKTIFTKFTFRGGRAKEIEIKKRLDPTGSVKTVVDAYYRDNQVISTFIYKHQRERALNITDELSGFMNTRMTLKKAKGEKVNFRSELAYIYEYYEFLVRTTIIDFLKTKPHIGYQEVHDAVYLTEPLSTSDIKSLELFIFTKTQMSVRLSS